MRRRLGTIMTVALLLAACGQADGSPTPTPSAASAVPSAAPTAPPATSAPPPTATGPRELPPGPCCRGTEVEAGTYRLPVDVEFDLTVEVPPGWRVIREDAVSVVALVRGENEIGDVSSWLAFFVLEAGELLADFQADMLATPGLEALAEPTDVTVAGVDGWRVDFRALPNPDFVGNPSSGIPPGTQVINAIQQYFVGGFNWVTSTPEARVTILTLEISGRDIVIYVEAPDAEADVAIDDAMAILETLESD